MHQLLARIGQEIIERGDHELGYSVLLLAQYVQADSSGEAQNYLDARKELFEKYGLIDILRLTPQAAKKRREFRHLTYNEEVLIG